MRFIRKQKGIKYLFSTKSYPFNDSKMLRHMTVNIKNVLRVSLNKTFPRSFPLIRIVFKSVKCIFKSLIDETMFHDH